MGEIAYSKDLLFCSVPERIHEVCHSWPACVHQIHEDSGKSCLEIQRQVQHPRECLMPRSSIHSQLGWGWAGLLSPRRYQGPVKPDSWCQLLGSKCQGQGCTCPVSHTHRQWCHAPVFSSQLNLGRMEMHLLPPTSMHREGTDLTLFCTFTPEMPLKCFLRWFLPLPQLNICIEPSKNLLLNLQDKIILKYLHCIQHWCRQTEKVVHETFFFKYHYCKTSPPPSVTKD